MGIPVVDNFAESQSMAAQACVQKTSNLMKSRYSRSQRICKRGNAIKKWIIVGTYHPLVCHRFRQQNMQGLVYSDHVRYPRKLVLTKRSRCRSKAVNR